MNFATDRDLLILEPYLFRDAGWAGQTLVKGAGTIAAGTLTIDSPAINLAVRGVSVGMVALVNGMPVEITALPTSTSATVSLIRDDAGGGGANRTPPDIAGVPASITTFGPQIALTHAQLLRMLGVEKSGTGGGGATGTDTPIGTLVNEDSITNRTDCALLESLGALHLIYSAAAAMLGPDSAPGRRATMYADRFARERFRAAASLDTDGDGIADAVRRFSTVHLVRA